MQSDSTNRQTNKESREKHGPIECLDLVLGIPRLNLSDIQKIPEHLFKIISCRSEKSNLSTIIEACPRKSGAIILDSGLKLAH